VIFSAVCAVLLKPLPFKGSDRLVFILKKNRQHGWTRNPISPAEILAWQNRSGAFEDIAVYTQRTCVLTGGREAAEDPCEVIFEQLVPPPEHGPNPATAKQISSKNSQRERYLFFST